MSTKPTSTEATITHTDTSCKPTSTEADHYDHLHAAHRPEPPEPHRTWSLKTLPLHAGSKTTEHLLQAGPLNEILRSQFWLVARKPFSSLEDLGVMAWQHSCRELEFEQNTQTETNRQTDAEREERGGGGERGGTEGERERESER